MWLRTDNNLINLDNVGSFEGCTQPNGTVFVYANFAGCENPEEWEFICICRPDEVQPLLDAIADALEHHIAVFSVPEWLDYHRQDKEDNNNANPF